MCDRRIKLQDQLQAHVVGLADKNQIVDSLRHAQHKLASEGRRDSHDLLSRALQGFDRLSSTLHTLEDRLKRYIKVLYDRREFVAWQKTVAQLDAWMKGVVLRMIEPVHGQSAASLRLALSVHEAMVRVIREHAATMQGAMDQGSMMVEREIADAEAILERMEGVEERFAEIDKACLTRKAQLEGELSVAAFTLVSEGLERFISSLIAVSAEGVPLGGDECRVYHGLLRETASLVSQHKPLCDALPLLLVRARKSGVSDLKDSHVRATLLAAKFKVRQMSMCCCATCSHAFVGSLVAVCRPS